jgi:anti-sigma factor RsiW
VTTVPIDCHSAMRQLWDFLDDELPPERLEEIRQHLAVCTGCSAHVEFCRSFLSQIDTAPVAISEVERLKLQVREVLRQAV